jgi:hypothetical protein
MSHIYFIGAPAVSMVKVGYSRDVEKRVRRLRATSPCPLVLLAIIPVATETQRRDGVALEAFLRRRYAAQHSHNEWFRDEGLLKDDLSSAPNLTRLQAIITSDHVADLAA